MRKCSGARSDEVDREHWGADGAVAVSRLRIRRALLLWAAAGAMLFGGGLTAHAQVTTPEVPDVITPDSDECTISGTTVTCKGDLSAGVEVHLDESDEDYITLIVTDLETDITPSAERESGIFFGVYRQSGGIEIIVNTGAYRIITTGDQEDGIGADAYYEGEEADLPITIQMTGDIETHGRYSDGIEAYTFSDSPVVVTMDGKITITGPDSIGIFARSSGDVTVTLTGKITTEGDNSKGIMVAADYEFHDYFDDYDDPDGPGNVTVTVTGTIKTTGEKSAGILATAAGDGAVTISVTGTIKTTGEGSEGILATAAGDGAVTISVTGNIETLGGCPVGDDCSDGISADSESGVISITLHEGTISSANGVGVRFKRGAQHTLTNTLTITDAVTISGGTFDVMGEEGNEKIINAGTLTARGVIDLGGGTNAFDNQAGATFHSGTAVVLGAGNAFTNWGDLSPGGTDALQQTKLTGNFVNQKEGTFTVTIDEAGSDRLDVIGTADLQGGTVSVTLLTDTDAGTYIILTATEGVTGAFDDVIDTLFVDNRLSYGTGADGDYVELSFTVKEFCEFAETANQRELACDGLDSLDSGNAIVQAVRALTTIAQARAAFDGLLGEVHVSLKGALADAGQRQVGAINRRMATRFGNAESPAAPPAGVGNPAWLADGRNGWWITGYGSGGGTDATPDTAPMDTALGGVLFGFDRALGKHWGLGLLGGYSNTDVTQSAHASSGAVQSWSAGAYGGAKVGAARLSVGAIYSGHALEARRAVDIADFSNRLAASYQARSWQVFGEAGYQLPIRSLLLEPVGGVSFVSLATDSFSETGGAAALRAAADTANTTFTTLGVRSALALKDKAHARAMVGWRHAFGDTNPASTFTMAGSSPFTTMGAPTAANAVVTELGIDASFTDTAVFGMAYHGRYGAGTTAHGFNAALKVKF